MKNEGIKRNCCPKCGNTIEVCSLHQYSKVHKVLKSGRVSTQSYNRNEGPMEISIAGCSSKDCNVCWDSDEFEIENNEFIDLKYTDIPNIPPKKWAIYKGEVGKYAKEYIDNMRVLQETSLIGIVKKEYLPIIINRVGGYTGFDIEYEKKHGFIEIVENDEFPLKRQDMFPKNSKEFHYGWIDLEGNTYACNFEDHLYAATFLCKEQGLDTRNPEWTLEDLGWLKISRKAPYTPDNINSKCLYTTRDFITKAQYDCLCEMGMSEDRIVKYLFNQSEPTW